MSHKFSAHLQYLQNYATDADGKTLRVGDEVTYFNNKGKVSDVQGDSFSVVWNGDDEPMHYRSSARAGIYKKG